MHVFIGLYKFVKCFFSSKELLWINRVKLHHFDSVHNQLLAAESYRLTAFERKYGLGGPIPEGLTNYLDVRKRSMDYLGKYSLPSGTILR